MNYSEWMNAAARTRIDLVAEVERAQASTAFTSKKSSACRVTGDEAIVVLVASQGWYAGVRLQSAGGAWGLVELLLRPDGRDGHLAPMNQVNLTEIVDRAQRKVSRHVERTDAARLNTGDAPDLDRRLSVWKERGAAKGPADYATLAAAYVEELRKGNSRATAAIAERAGTTPAVMAQRIKEARRRGLLTAGEKGRASGELTALGVLYTDPDFPGFRALRNKGWRLADIAKEYGWSEAAVWNAITLEHGSVEGDEADEGNPYQGERNSGEDDEE